MNFKTSAWLAAMLLFSDGVRNVVADESAAAGVEFFEKQIRPVLVEHCLSCHGEKKQEGGLRLTAHEAILKGGDTGPAIVSGQPDDSLLIRAVGYLDEPKMPPKQKLPDTDIEKLRQWVAMGAPWPATEAPPENVSDKNPHGFAVTAKQQSWWAWQPVRDSTPPVVRSIEWPQNEIDHFILAELESRSLQFASPAERAAWLRRATFDLTGLPPTPEQLDAFIADASDVAYERIVDRLLESPAYGQRWARHWLDVVRYADYHDGDPKARNPVCEPLEAWRYRDWVVESLNRDLPFDQFITHQIAGDLLSSPAGTEPYADGLIATTFLVNGAWDRGDADKEKLVSDMVDDQIDTVGKAFLGLTLGCARCHDHKFDPISHQDYYALAGIFYSTRMLQELGVKGGEITLQRRPLVPSDVVESRKRQVLQIEAMNQQLAELDKLSPKPADDDPRRKEIIERRDQLHKSLPPEIPMALAVSEGGVPGGLFPGIQDVPIHVRGSYARLETVVPRRMPAFFQGENPVSIAGGSGRRELAAWVTSRKNPLTPRVIVNRVWQWHFGAGLVNTPDNFGLLSEPPSHPALLDWLTVRFFEDGWSLKKLHRRIMLSATYRQNSVVPREQFDRDPENRWLSRFPSRRLEAEAVRDAILRVSGQLDAALGGPAQADVAITRRSLYVQTARWDRSNFATLFDAANPDSSVEARTVSTVAPQALFLLNNGFLLDQAKHLADRLVHDVPTDGPNTETARIQHAYRLLFGRLPSDDELNLTQKVVSQGNSTGSNAGWVDLAHVLLCSNEFVYLD